MHIQLKREVFGDGQGAPGRQGTLDDRVVGEVEQHDDSGKYAALFKALAEILRNVLLNAHGGKDNAEIGAVGAADFCLADDLHRQIIMCHTGAGKNRQFLTADQGHQRVDSRDAGIDIVFGIDARYRVDRRAVDVGFLHRKDVAESVDRSAGAVEHSAEQLG